jgi:hypothetical protein
MMKTHPRTALLVAHPGHELRLHRWMELARPAVFVLTDGSGRFRPSRLDSTRQVLDALGLKTGSIFGRLTDAKAYEAMRGADTATFTNLAHELAEEFVERKIDFALGDAAEGANPSHDLCRGLVNAAVALARRSTGRRVGCYDYAVMGRPDDCPEKLRRRAIWIRLDADSFERKRAAAQAYPGLENELEGAIGEAGEDAFRVECLRPVDPRSGIAPAEDPPLYERFGEKQVAAGYYDHVIRYREHLRPIDEALRSLARRTARSPR